MRLYKKTVFILIFILVIPFAYAQNCTDSDGGLNYNEKGCVTFFGMEYCDRCVTPNILIEGYCNEDKLFLTASFCLNSCKNGKCTQITTTTETTTTTSTTTTSTTTTTPPAENIALSCEGTPSNSCSQKKDSYLGVPDIEGMDFFIPDSADCEDTIGVTVKWTGWHGYKGKYYTDDINSPYIQYNDTNIDECTPNYWAVFLETSTGSYSLLGTCQSFNEPDCELFDPNNYTMSFNVKMPNKNTIVDGTYNILVTGETDSGYCNPDESNVDIKVSKQINLVNCGSVSSSATTTSTTTTPGSTNTPIITTTPISDEVSPTTELTTTTTTELTTTTTTELTTTTTTELTTTTTTELTTTTTIYRGGGCPTLFVYNGKDYVKERKSNIHSQPGIDTVDDIALTTKPFVVDGNYLLSLKETTLPEHSYIDSVKLFVTDSEGRKEAELVSAKHSKYGDVTSALENSDDVRTDTQVFDNIELKFKVPELKGEAKFTFEIEGYNPAVNILDKGVSIIGQVIMSGNIITKFDIADFSVVAAVVAVIAIILVFGFFKFFARKK